jgi:hypothetical protein
LGDQVTKPFGVLYTGKNVVSFWPAFPNGTDMTRQVDHVTLSLSSGKSHCTGFDLAGNRYQVHGKRASWPLHTFTDSPVQLWFPLYMQWSVLQQQELTIQRRVDCRSEAGKMRIQQMFIKCIEAIQNPIVVKLPPTMSEPRQYVLCNVYYATKRIEGEQFLPDMLVTPDASHIVDGWTDHNVLFNPTMATRGDHTFIFAAACPAGVLATATLIGLPKRGRRTSPFSGDDIKPPHVV